MEDQNNGSAPVATVDAPVQQPAAPAQLPDDTRDRTRDQFNKLIDSNRSLNDTNAALVAEIQAMRKASAEQSAPRPQQAPVQQQQQAAPATINPNDFVERDPNTGEAFINEQKLKQAIDSANSRALEVEKVMQDYISAAERREAERQNREAYSLYPELEPGTNNFNPDFNKQVRGILQDSMWNMDDYGGRPLSFREAADYVRKFNPVAPVVTPEQAQAQAQAEEQSREAQALKEQGSATPEGQRGNEARQNITDNEELDNLRYRTRYLDDNAALAERIKHTEHILAPDATLK